MRIDLIVPYEEKELAKRKGAKWDDHKKVWYIIDPTNIFDFVQWAPERLKKATTAGPLKHPEHIVTQPRTPRFKKKKRI